MSKSILPDQVIRLQGTTKDCLQRAAIYFLLRQGYAATGIRDITEYCQVSSASLYTHYPSKDSIIFAIIEQEINYCHAVFFPLTQRNNISALKRINLFVTMLKKFLQEREESQFVHVLAPELISSNPLYQSLIQNYMNAWITLLNALLKPLVKNPRVTSKKVLCAIHGSILLAHIFKDKRYIERMCVELKKFYFTK